MTTKIPTMSDATEVFAEPGAGHIIDCIHPNTGRSWINDEDLEAVRRRYPNAQRFNFDEWCAEKARRQDTPVTWDETTEEFYMEMLEVLPPACWMRGGFLVGEPADHHAKSGLPRFQAHIKRGGKYLVASRPMTRDEFKALFAPENASVAAELAGKAVA